MPDSGNRSYPRFKPKARRSMVPSGRQCCPHPTTTLIADIRVTKTLVFPCWRKYSRIGYANHGSPNNVNIVPCKEAVKSPTNSSDLVLPSLRWIMRPPAITTDRKANTMALPPSLGSIRWDKNWYESRSRPMASPMTSPPGNKDSYIWRTSGMNGNIYDGIEKGLPSDNNVKSDQN